MRPLLEISHLDKQIGTLHLADISFTLEPGYIFGLIGCNGAGKTSLIRTILNLYRRDSGSVIVNGFSMDSMEREAKDQIGFVLDEFLFEDKLSLSTNGKLFGSAYTCYNHDLFLKFCSRFGLDPRQKAGRLSKGQKTRFQLAFALSHQAKLFVMDEPAAGLDPLFRRELTGYMQELVEDGTRSILFSTHLTADLDQIGDYIALIDEGRFCFCMDKESLKERFSLLRGTEQEILSLHSPHILAAVHDAHGSTALAEYPDQSLIAGLNVSHPTLAELMYYLRKGRCIS